MKTKLFSLFTVFCLLIGVTGALSSCTPPADTTSAAYITLDINPSIELTTDEKGKVTSVYAANEDAQILLYNESGIVGADLEVAVDAIVALAVEYGYLSEDNKVVSTSVVCDNEKDVSSLLDKVNATVVTGAQRVGLEVTTTAEAAYSLLREFEAYKSAHPENTAIQGLSVTDYKLAVSASENGEITMEAAISMDREQLIQQVTEAHQRVKEYVTDAYLVAKQQASAIYDKAVGLALDGVYTTYYMTHAMQHLTTCYYGPVYQIYRSSARVLDSVADAYELAIKIASAPLDEEQLLAVCSALNIHEDQVQLLANADGAVTLASIQAYADRVFKNTPEGAQLQTMKAELHTALLSIEADVKATIEEEFAPMIEQVLSEVDELISAGEASLEAISILASNAQTYIDDIRSILAQCKATLETEHVSAEGFRGMVTLLNEKADAVLTLIEDDLSEEELADIEELLTNAESTAAAAKESMNQALARAEESARTKLQERKDARKNGS